MDWKQWKCDAIDEEKGVYSRIRVAKKDIPQNQVGVDV